MGCDSRQFIMQYPFGLPQIKLHLHRQPNLSAVPNNNTDKGGLLMKSSLLQQVVRLEPEFTCL
ncbi:MAG: hypothetical protein BMS9Abin06_0912 [Gammaproteobacteria bacterium]|nr:MAG: hypothetical protein BMS9Abin06_0912 [Gammaproteobacteria bacterium]